MFTWLINLFKKKNYHYRFEIQVKSFSWGFSYTYKEVHQVDKDVEVPSSVLKKGCLYHDGEKFRQFNTLSTGVSLWDIQGDTAVVSDRYGTSFYRLLNEIAKYCTNKEAAIVDFCLEEELVVAFTGIERLDWMINNCHDLTITSPDGKNVRVIEKEEFNRLILRGKQDNDRSDNTD